MDNAPPLCNADRVPSSPKRRNHGGAAAARGEPARKRISVDQSVNIPGVSPSGKHAPENLPQPWLIGTAEILAELERIRGLALAVPLTLASNGPVNSVVDALWRFEEELRYVLRLQAQAQSAFAERSGGNGVASGAAARSAAVPGVHA